MKRAAAAFTITALALFPLLSFSMAGSAEGKELELKGISFLSMTTEHAKSFENFISKVNARAGGKMKITCLGGPEVIGANEQTQALRTGVVDIAIAPIAYQLNLVPEALVWTITMDEPWVERSAGLYEYLSGFYKKANMHLLGGTGRGAKMYFYLNKKVARPQDLNGMKIRSTSIVSTLLKKLGCKGVTVPRADFYVAMERGLIDGFPSPADVVLSLGQQEVCKYWIDHGFLVSVITWVVNENTWNKIPPDMQQLMSKTMEEMEREYYPRFFQLDIDCKKKLADQGVEKIEFSPADAKAFMKTVYESYSEDLDKATPNAQKLRSFVKRHVGE